MPKNSKLIAPPSQRLPGIRRGIESVPAHYLVLTPDFIIVNASDLFLQNTMTMRDTILGRSIFEVFPENPHDPADKGVAQLKASFLRVLERRAMDMLHLMKYSIPKPSADGGFEDRYWNPVNFPLFDKYGNLTHIVHNSEDVTKLVLQRRQKALAGGEYSFAME